MTQETSQDFAYPINTLIAPYIPKREDIRKQTGDLAMDAITRAASDSRGRDWDSMSAPEQIDALTRKLPPIERMAQAATLLSNNPPYVQSWTEGDRRTFMGRVVSVEKDRVQKILDGTIPQTDIQEANGMRKRAQGKITEYDALLAKLQARATPNGPARR